MQASHIHHWGAMGAPVLYVVHTIKFQLQTTALIVTDDWYPTLCPTSRVVLDSVHKRQWCPHSIPSFKIRLQQTQDMEAILVHCSHFLTSTPTVLGPRMAPAPSDNKEPAQAWWQRQARECEEALEQAQVHCTMAKWVGVGLPPYRVWRTHSCGAWREGISCELATTCTSHFAIVWQPHFLPPVLLNPRQYIV